MNYNRVRMYRCILGLALLALLIVYAISFENNNVQAMSFSVESGFYDEEFYLEINGTGTIYYTMDSSDPNKNSLVYTEPILIKDASDNENSYSMLTDVCPELNEELKDLGIVGDSGYSVPEHPVDKATVVKAVCIDKNGNCSDIITGVYFVGFGNKSGYDNIHIVSIVTDPDNLFGYENGIYVAGKNFDDNYVRLESLNDAWRRANYFKRGIDSGRLSTVSIWNADRTMVSNGTFILKIQGNASRAGLPKSLKISEISPLESQLNGTQLGFSSDIDSVILFGGAQDRYLKLRDYLVNNVCKELNITVRESVPCELFLDGEYWGTYYLYEPLDSLFFENHYGVIPGNVEYAEYVPATNTVEAGNSSDNSMYNSMYDFIAMNDMSIPENYLQAQELIDIDSYLDYYAVEVYIVNQDWLPNNYGLWRTRASANNIYSDNKWRWVLYDVNLAAMDASFSSSDRVSWAINNDSTFASLMENEEFESELYDRLIYLAENVFYPSDVDAFIDNYETEMAGPMQNDYQRFYENRRTIDDFYNGCEDVKKFFHQRYDYIMETYGGENE